MLFTALSFVLLGCLTSWLVIALFLRCGLGASGAKLGQYHHTHTGLVPRIGGTGIAFGFTATYLLCFFLFDKSDNYSVLHYSVFAGGVAAFLLGFIDDIRPLGAKVKLLAQIIIALFAYHGGLQIETVRIPYIDYTLTLGYFGIVATVLWVVALMNLINLIDGIDGLAGGVGLMLMGLLAYLAYGGSLISFVLALGMCGTILGFLIHNFPPAKVYMGDSGAYMIGYVIASLALINSEKGSVLAAMIAPVLALALPICDVAFAIIRRGLKGMPLFRPDRGHIHHRLIASGLSRQHSVLVLYAISLVALLGGLLAYSADGRYLPVFLGFVFLFVLLLMRRQRMSPKQLSRIVNESWEARQDTKNALKLRDWFVLEAGRADSGEHLWSDFQFVLRKIGFCRARLRIGKTERNFFIPNSQHDQLESLWEETHDLDPDVELILFADKDFFSQRQFNVISDIAGEAWAGAANLWYLNNGELLTFHSMAKEPVSYREQKTRSLYRPTY